MPLWEVRPAQQERSNERSECTSPIAYVYRDGLPHQHKVFVLCATPTKSSPAKRALTLPVKLNFHFLLHEVIWWQGNWRTQPAVSWQCNQRLIALCAIGHMQQLPPLALNLSLQTILYLQQPNRTIPPPLPTPQRRMLAKHVLHEWTLPHTPCKWNWVGNVLECSI